MKSRSVSPPAIPFESVIEVFARGFAFTRSFTHPYVVHRTDGMWWLRDEPPQRKDGRNDEWIAWALKPADIDRVARQKSRGRFALSVILANGERDETLRAEFKALGYRLIATETLMMHRLARLSRRVEPPESFAIGRVTTPAEAEELNRTARRRQILPGHITAGLDTPLRAYVARAHDGRVVGWVRSIAAGPATWVSNMYVVPPLRRRGLGRALLLRMLRDDRATQAQASVLLASHTGALLYPVVGYEKIGTLCLFVPR